MMGLSPSALPASASELPAAPLAVGANCGVGASDLLVSIQAMRGRSSIPLIAKANCGIPQWHGDHIHYSETADLMADDAALAANAGAAIIGGCCGTSALHLAAMRRSLDQRIPGEQPTLDEILGRLGPLVNPPGPDGTGT